MHTGFYGNDPFGSRPEPGACLIALILLLPPGEVPEGPAGVHLQSICFCAAAHSKAGAGTGRYPSCITHPGDPPLMIRP